MYQSHSGRETYVETDPHTNACIHTVNDPAQLDSQLQEQPAGDESRETRKRWREMESAVAKEEAFEG